MEDKNNAQQNGFTYTYSAHEQAEIKKIREKYTPHTEAEDKMARLRRLDASVTQTAQVVALIWGIVGALVLGLGMSLCMTEFSEILGAYRHMAMGIGIIVGAFGCVLTGLAYPIYHAIVKAKRKKLAPEIIRLADELTR